MDWCTAVLGWGHLDSQGAVVSPGKKRPISNLLLPHFGAGSVSWTLISTLYIQRHFLWSTVLKIFDYLYLEQTFRDF